MIKVEGFFIVRMRLLMLNLAPNKIQMHHNRKTTTIRKQTPFEHYYHRGRQLQHRNPEQSLQQFQRALGKYNPSQDQFYRKVDLTLDQARILTRLGDYQSALSALTRLESEICSEMGGQVDVEWQSEQELEMLQFWVKLVSEKCEVYLSKVQNSRNKEQLQETITTTVITYSMLKSSSTHTAYTVSKTISRGSFTALPTNWCNEWQQLYCDISISSIGPILLQINYDEYPDEKMYYIVEQIAEKVDLFYRMSAKGTELRKSRAKSWYYRAAMGVQMGKGWDKVREFAIRDYQFCQSHGLEADLAKTKEVLIKYYLRTEKPLQALQYFPESSKKTYRKQIQSYQQELQSLQNQLSSPNFQKQTPQSRLQTLEQYFLKIEDETYSWWNRYIQTIRSLLLRQSGDGANPGSDGVKLEMYFGLAKAYFQVHDQVNAEHYCEAALRECAKVGPKTYEVLKYYYDVLEKCETRKNKMEQVLGQLRELARRLGKEKELNSELKIMAAKKERAAFIQSKLLNNEDQKHMFCILKSRTDPPQNPQSHAQVEVQGHPRHPSQSFLVPQIAQQFQQSLTQLYTQKCREQNLAIRSPILGLLAEAERKGSRTVQILFQEYFGLGEQEVLLLIGFCSAKSYDMRNVAIGNQVLEVLSQMKTVQEVQTLKLANLGKQISADKLLRLLGSLPNLEQLHLENLMMRKQHQLPASLITTPIPNLQILKLKQCNIQDQHLPLLKAHTPKIQQLDLSKNPLTGESLSHLAPLALLQNLNLSYTAVTEIHSLCNYSLEKLKLKGVSGTLLPHEFRLQQIRYLHVLDLSENGEGFVEGCLQALGEMLLGHGAFEIPAFRELRVKRAKLTVQLFGTVNRFLTFCNRVQVLDLRFGSVGGKELQNFCRYQKQCGKVLTVLAEGCARNPPHLPN